MTRDYLNIYASLIEKRAVAPRARVGPLLVANRAAEGAGGAGERAAALGLRESRPVATAGEPRTGS